MKERFTGPKARLAATTLAVVSAGGAAAACTPAQQAALEGMFPCPTPGPIAAAAGGETGDSQTAVINRTAAVEIPAFLTNGETIVVCFPTGEQAVARPRPIKGNVVLDQIVHQEKTDIEKTSYGEVKRAVNSFWEKY